MTDPSSPPVASGGVLDDPSIGGGVDDPALTAGTVGGQEPAGPPGRDGIDGRDGGNTTYAFAFTLEAVWSIAHGLGRYPSVTTLETTGDQVVGDLAYPDANTAQVTFSVPVSGTAYLN